MEVQRPYTCFFIAQMSTEEDMQRLRRIARDLLTPILAPLGYKVVTPDEPSGSASIFTFVMKMIDTADLLVADLTANNANVYYELAIRHSLGLPFALISQDNIKFDIAGMRYVKYDPNKLDDAAMCEQLLAMLAARHEDIVSKRDTDNPISNFYGEPLAEVSPASGLALGYYRNFVRYSMGDIRNNVNVITVEGNKIIEAEQSKIHLQIWIPNRLLAAYHKSIRDFVVDTGTLLQANIHIEKGSRDIPLYALPDRSERLTLVDIPTALNAMEVAIGGRYSGMRLDKESKEWLALEQQEIDRFKDHIQRHLHNEEDALVKRNVSIIDWNVDNL